MNCNWALSVSYPRRCGGGGGKVLGLHSGNHPQNSMVTMSIYVCAMSQTRNVDVPVSVLFKPVLSDSWISQDEAQ